MEQKNLLKHIVFLMFLISVFDVFAWNLDWYYTIWWFDIPMHFFGGVWVSFFFLYVFQYVLPVKKQFLAVILSVLAVGILWEFFEYYLNVVSTEPFSIIDTLTDLAFDILGGISAMYYNEYHAKHG